MSVDVNQMLIYHTSEWLSLHPGNDYLYIPEMIISTSQKWLSRHPGNTGCELYSLKEHFTTFHNGLCSSTFMRSTNLYDVMDCDEQYTD